MNDDLVSARARARGEETVRIGVAARELALSVDTLRRWEAAGLITTVRSAGGQRLITRAELDRIRANRARGGPSDAA